MVEGGVLTIETANRSLGPVAASKYDLPPGDYAAVSVADTGKGMSDEILARAFDPFFTTKPLGEGTGLGLSMVFGFARQSGGQVTIDSEEGHGSTVRMYLPKHSSDPQVDLNTSAPAAAPEKGHELVLVIDDEAVISILVTDALEEAGYSTIEAHDGPTGLRALEANPSISLLITDVGLPGGLDGGQVAEAARSSRPDLKVIFITGYVADAAVGGAPLQPEMAVITKPFKIDELVAKVREMLHG